ncbi:MAG: TrmB family transcriptional regulator [Halomonadaceae bacterium]|nr:TrmB family transcriptional regulator [Halomonadaceae bacterium]
MANRLRFDESVSSGLSSEMQKLGFTDYEAKIYIQLLRMHPVTAYELSKVTGVPRANAYHALESLTRKEAVQPVSEDPVRFVPVPPQVLLEGIASSTQRRCDRLTSQLNSLSKSEDTQYVWTISGEPAVDERIKQMVLSAKTSIWIKAQDQVLRRHDEVLRSMAHSGVEIFIILFGEDAEEFRYSDNVEIYLHEGNGKTIGTADNLFTITVDHEQLLTANVQGKVFASYTHNQPIVTTAESLIRHDYYMAEIMLRYGDEIHETFGSYLKSLRESRFTPEQLERFHQQLGLN